jgi:predicted AAA+ superfamily ATPase
MMYICGCNHKLISNMIERDFYIAQLENFIDKPFVKIITGIRRSGWS